MHTITFNDDDLKRMGDQTKKELECLNESKTMVILNGKSFLVDQKDIESIGQKAIDGGLVRHE